MPILRGLLAFTAFLASVLSVAGAETPLEYNRDIRPILAEFCFKCHGPDSAARQADLRLDQRDVAVKARAFVPGKPESSEAIRRIFSHDADEVMPPPKQPKQPTARHKELLRQWIQGGAEYQVHWSFIPPRRGDLPAVKNPAWVRNSIDAFVLARLESAGLAPAPEADRRSLARRLSFDLRGLPPLPDEVEAFVRDSASDAYEKLVDRYLNSPHWGEHRARYWLDAARYADTHGIHFDNYREIWVYRDWVIQAFNRNLPFDTFTREQLAGDLLPQPTLDQLVASGFNRCNMTTNEGGIIDAEYLVLYARERTETFAQIWLGLTMNCATCHDHKFDPISQREFYELSAYFNNSTQAAKDGNIKDTPPIVAVPSLPDRKRWHEVGDELAAARKRLDARKQVARPDFLTWRRAVTADDIIGQLPSTNLLVHAPLSEGKGDTLQINVEGDPRTVPLPASSSWQPGPEGGHAVQPQGALCQLEDVGDFERDRAFSCSAWVKLPANDSQGSIASRMDSSADYRGWDFWMERRRIGMHIINRWSNNAIKVLTQNQIPANQFAHVAVTYDGSGKAAGVQIYVNGKRQETTVESDTLQPQDSIRTKVPFTIGQRHSSDPISGVAVQDLRLYGRALGAPEFEVLARAAHFAQLVAKPAGKQTSKEQDELFDWWLAAFDQPSRDFVEDVARIEREQNQMKARGTIAHVVKERDQAAMAFVLYRGDYDKQRDKVTPATPRILPPLPSTSAANRLGLADWVINASHPLTARVTVNRFWQEVFGTGIVSTPGDFGVTGDLPSHPELLDWLALDFQASGWDIKRLFKLMVMSNTYRQSATTTPVKLEQDPFNRLLSRGPRFRMDAEMIRDNALFASGLMSPRLGGPSVKPYQPEGVWEAIAMNVSNTRSYVRDSGEGLYRRSLYTFWKRMAPPASMEILNAPNREYCVVRRERTNTPLQALVSLNDPQFIEAARHLAQRTLTSASAVDDRCDWLARQLLARPLRAEEASIVRRSLSELLAYYGAHPDDARQLIAVGESAPDKAIEPSMLAAWTMLANQLLNLDEVLCK